MGCRRPILSTMLFTTFCLLKYTLKSGIMGRSQWICIEIVATEFTIFNWKLQIFAAFSSFYIRIRSSRWDHSDVSFIASFVNSQLLLRPFWSLISIYFAFFRYFFTVFVIILVKLWFSHDVIKNWNSYLRAILAFYLHHINKYIYIYKISSACLF